MSGTTTTDNFADFVADAEPRLRRALVASYGPDDGRDATAEALGYAWANWARVKAMANPIGYLYRVGQTKSRTRLQGHLPDHADHGRLPEFEPALGPALAELTDTQRTAVILVHGCQWTYQEVADALDVTKSTVGTHIERAMTHLRSALEVSHD